jgi:large subunit ribosomal protein L25
MSQIHEINADLRVGGTKGDARKVRQAGGTPGVVYRKGEAAVAVRFDGAALSSIFRKTNNPNTLITLSVAGQPHTCLIREIQRNPASRAVEHVDFYQVAKGEQVAVRVAVTTSGKAAGVRAGGQLRLLARTVDMLCDAYAIPNAIDVDVTALDVGRFIKASQLTAPSGSRIVFAQDFNVVTVQGKQAEVEAAPAAAPAAGAAAPAAAGAKAAPAAGKDAKAAPAAAKPAEKAKK